MYNFIALALAFATSPASIATEQNLEKDIRESTQSPDSQRASSADPYQSAPLVVHDLVEEMLVRRNGNDICDKGTGRCK